MTTPRTFDVVGPLPEGTVVLEASAGTGKTHTIAGLATRYVAEGVARIDQLMMVTFGRAATVELRERVRERLTGTLAALSDAAAPSSPDSVVAHLATGAPEVVAARRRRLLEAVADFDAATIATTHGFAHQMLDGLGVAADVDRDVAFVETASDLVGDVVTDLYVRAYGKPDSETPAFDLATADRVGQVAVGDRAARLEPTTGTPGRSADVRRRLAEATRREVELRKRRGRVMDYDDLLVHLRDALVDPATGPHAQERIRSRYSVVLVDEFQDTDPVQWEILRSTFHGHRTLVLIGDPKQAIYAFRGADVVTYLQATEAADTSATLGTNWRSDAPLVAALGRLLGDVALGDPRIRVLPVDAAHAGRRLVGAPDDAPLRIRQVVRSSEDDGLLKVKDVRPLVARDVAADVAALLDSAATLRVDDTERPVVPADVAVLVQRNDDAATVRDALEAVGVPVVLTGTSSVFGSDAAADWLTLLTALEQPHRPGLARAAALTCFHGWSAWQLGVATDDDLDGLSTTLRSWSDVLGQRGVAALLEVMTASHRLTERVLSRVHGERDLTDLRHVGQALHETATRQDLGVAALVQWLARRVAEAKEDVTEERSRRLESDAQAVQVITVHRSKGLQFPVVYAPFLWDRWANDKPDPLRFHDESGSRVLDVGGVGGPGWTERRDAHLAEDAGESLRLAYVALTRARSQVVVHWAPTWNTEASALQRLLFGARDEHGSLPASVPVGSDADAQRRFATLAEGPDVTWAAVGGRGPVERLHDAREPSPIQVRSFDRRLDLAWSRTSYSGLTAGLHEAGHAAPSTGEPDEPGTVDEPEVVPVVSEPGPDALPSPMGALPLGASFGTLVHEVFETADFTAADLPAHLVAEAAAAGADRFPGMGSVALGEALVAPITTPLGPLAPGLRLADVGRVDRLDELGFEMPMVGGDVPTGEATVGQIAELLRRHLPSDDPMAGYADDLEVPVLLERRLRGFLTGSIDLVLRVRDDAGTPRHLVVDYKTNWVGGYDEPLTSWHYRPEATARAMRDAHYPLQALLYCVALHRFLRWRQPCYDPALHLGGVLYLFVRGMCGPATPVVGGVPCGVFSWSPPAALVVALSDLLDRGAA
ncbi:MAG: UvrD-helicase domain-containing protein [Nocardioidaceae bacterium]|nr:UvrD-helicase domain-containing protein [Nocardioidaceae bacterium]